MQSLLYLKDKGVELDKKVIDKLTKIFEKGISNEEATSKIFIQRVTTKIKHLTKD